MKKVLLVSALIFSSNAFCKGFNVEVTNISTKEKRSFWIDESAKKSTPIAWTCRTSAKCRVTVGPMIGMGGAVADLICLSG